MSECTLQLQRLGKPYPRTCPTCGLSGKCHYETAMTEPAAPKLGDRSTCRQCGKPIEFIAPYWRHIGTDPRHAAKPFDFDTEEETAQTVEDGVSPELVTEAVAMIRIKRASGDLYAACEAWEKVERLQTRAALNMWDSVAVDALQSALAEAKRLTHTALANARGE